VRGTGKSGAIHCPVLGFLVRDNMKRIANCAEALGPRRDFFGTPDHARDLEAVRQALGAGKVALAAVSYGTELAVEYAREYPAHVERMLLDSVARLDRTDPFAAHVFS
jgi:pimeloyl-ACP methyl ester carboxylesterase